MTKADYLSEHGPEIRKFLNKPAGKEFLNMLRDEHPNMKVHKLAATDRLNGAAVFLNEGAGFSQAIELIAELLNAPKDPVEPPDKFEESEI